FLFGQAEGRDFWQTPLLPVHLLVQAVIAGAGALLVFAPALSVVLAGALITHALLVLAETVVPHANLMVAQSSELIVKGPYARRFWLLAVLGGVLLPLVLLGLGMFVPAGLLALLGLLVYEDIWVHAGQAVPLS
ncbi:MAG: 4Fe-4S ferredoxin, partial [Chloroflexota bacterium]